MGEDEEAATRRERVLIWPGKPAQRSGAQGPASIGRGYKGDREKAMEERWKAIA
jgi:hypothetical protein